jgi:hypothetical protein
VENLLLTAVSRDLHLVKEDASVLSHRKEMAVFLDLFPFPILGIRVPRFKS